MFSIPFCSNFLLHLTYEAVQRRRRHIGHARHRLFIRVLILPIKKNPTLIEGV